MSSQKQGCLGFLFGLFGMGATEPAKTGLPYRQRQDFLSRAELSFYHVLRTAVGEAFTVCCKVRLGDIFHVVGHSGKEWTSWSNRISSKHVDFLICEAHTMQPVAAVELDDSSHERGDRQGRDAFVDRVFEAAGLPIMHEQARRAYTVDSLRESLRLALAMKREATAVAAAVAPGRPPTCPRCGVEMVLRTAKKGEQSGSQFWGCPNYPRCRQTIPVEPR